MAATKPVVQHRPSGRAVLIAFGVAIAAAIALVVAVVAFRGGGDEATTPSGATALDLSGIEQTGRVLGDPDARVTLIEYADPQCPYCRVAGETYWPKVVEEYVRPAKINAEFRVYPFLGDDSVKAARFILAAGLQNRLWQLQEGLFRYQGAENAGWVTDDLIRARAAEIEGLDVDRLFTDAESDAVAQQVEDAIAEGSASGIAGTPAFLVQIGDEKPYELQGGLTVEQLQAALDDALAG